jgi:hypothetical protein
LQGQPGGFILSYYNAGFSPKIHQSFPYMLFRAKDRSKPMQQRATCSTRTFVSL